MEHIPQLSHLSFSIIILLSVSSNEPFGHTLTQTPQYPHFSLWNFIISHQLINQKIEENYYTLNFVFFNIYNLLSIEMIITALIGLYA